MRSCTTSSRVQPGTFTLGFKANFPHPLPPHCPGGKRGLTVPDASSHSLHPLALGLPPCPLPAGQGLLCHSPHAWSSILPSAQAQRSTDQAWSSLLPGLQTGTLCPTSSCCPQGPSWYPSCALFFTSPADEKCVPVTNDHKLGALKEWRFILLLMWSPEVPSQVSESCREESALCLVAPVSRVSCGFLWLCLCHAASVSV